MDYLELEKLYTFARDTNTQITKHGVVVPSKEVAEKLRDEYKIKDKIDKKVQVLSDGVTVSFVFGLGNYLTLFQRISSESDQYDLEPYEEYIEDYDE